ncbi:MAG TPA: alcohol dehydrogenase [Ramlibacter sp.]|nr:alcohol dehydrogenase [Ramlibacter sp.]
MTSWQVQDFGKPLVQAIREVPAPAGTQVVLRVDACGACHSDLHMRDGFFDLGHGHKLDLSRTVRPPRTLGHEIAGTVVACGPQAAGPAVGERRMVYPWIGCGSCRLCAAGQEHLCAAPQALGVARDGGFATHVVVPHPRYLLDFGGLPAEQACTLACAGVTAYSALKKVGRLAAGDALLLVGAGGVGLSGVRLAQRLCGVQPIVAEPDRAKWELARAAGAAEVVDPREEGALKALLKATGGGVAAAVDFVGSGSSFDFAIGAVRKAGRVVSVGLMGGATGIVPAMLSLKALSLVGSYVGSLEELGELLALAREGALPPMPVQTRGLAAASEVLDLLAAGQVRGRTVLVPGA